tara:strand:+ start:295 stop:444 length:150 start_codon:yes stop_codon:yes gene_type:complete
LTFINLSFVSFKEIELENLLKSMDKHYDKQADWLLNIENKFVNFNSKLV